MKEFLIDQIITLGAENMPKDYAQPLAYGDSMAHRWRVTVQSGGAAADLSGCTATMYFSRQDGKTGATAGTIAGNRAEAVFPAEAYAVEGAVAFEMVIQSRSATLTQAVMTARVRRRRTDDVIIPGGGEIYDLPALLAQIEAMKSATASAVSATDTANTAAQNANAQTQAAREATQDAQDAAAAAGQSAATANAAAAKIDGMTVSATGLAAGAAPTATVKDDGTKKIIAFGIPKGDQGDKGDKGEKGDKGDTGSIESLPYATTAPKAPGTASAGTAETIARGDHVHPAQTDITGNAGTAAKLKTARKIGNASFDGSADITLAQIGAYAAGSIRALAISLATSAWTGSGPYTATITRSDVTTKTWVDIYLSAASQANYSAAIDWSTETAGQITLSTTVKPTGTLAGSMVLTETA